MGAEEVELADALGRVLAAPIDRAGGRARVPRATMDGYAVRAQDTFGASVGAPQYLEIKGEVPMGAAPAGAWPAARPCGCPPAPCCPKAPTRW